MNKIYLFGIGGTGSRVIKSLTMLLASGIECNDKRIVPIIIDPDDAGADMTRTVDLMNNYMAVRSKLNFDSKTENKFFKTEIIQQFQNFRLPLNNTRDVKFKKYIDISSMSNSNKALSNILFSQQNLESNMKEGFKGNPNVGSVVLNQFQESIEFREFANNFEQGDEIFIISSIFGGTGASGFPLLLKTLRSSTKIPNYKLIQNARIGAITVLPYFGVTTNDDSEINSSSFISKAKSALSYYERNISDVNSVDFLYYISDDIRGQYENHEGGVLQKNEAHVIELLSALAIIDFASTKASDSEHRRTIHKEYGLNDNASQIIFENLGPATQDLLQKPLVRFSLLGKYMKSDCLKKSNTQPWKDKNFGQDKTKLNSEFFNTQFFNNIQQVLTEYQLWLSEMKHGDSSKRKFSPINLETKADFFDIVVGKNIKKLRKLSSGEALFDNYLNKYIGSIKNHQNAEHCFTELFYKALNEIVDKKYKF